MLGPHLTDQNLTEVLLRAKHRTKKEIARLVRQLDPLPEVPPRIEPLGPAPARVVPGAPTWDQFVRSLCPVVRELTPGERPRDWMGDTNDVEPRERDDFELPDDEVVNPSAGAPGPYPPAEPPPLEPAVRAVPRAPLSPERYKVQFTAGEEFVKLVEEARALLSHSAPHATLDEIQLRAMRALVAELQREKYAVTVRPRKRCCATPSPAEPVHPSRSTAEPELPHSAPEPWHPRQRGRNIPAAVRRAVFQRDEGRCTYADASGRRCAETHRLELHHLNAFARGGDHTETNLALRCRAHNTLAAEEDFGRELIEHARSASEHEPWSAQPDD
jgi:5-methylcytosine-specific restriction endonuclease McrA